MVPPTPPGVTLEHYQIGPETTIKSSNSFLLNESFLFQFLYMESNTSFIMDTIT